MTSFQETLVTLADRMTLADLAKYSGRSVESILELAFGGAQQPARANGVVHKASPPPRAPVRRTVPSPPPTARPMKANGAVDTRTESGRIKYEEQVAAVIQAAKSPVGAVEVREAVGGTPDQFRKAANRLIDQGLVDYHGKARATRYTWAG